MATPAGLRNRRFRFERRAFGDDGERTGPWDPRPVIVTWASVVYLRGSEPVIAQRLAGVQPAALNVRYCHALREVDNTFRAVDMKSGEIFGLIGATATINRREIDILGERGAGDGQSSDA